jgi:hypothetical protein
MPHILRIRHFAILIASVFGSAASLTYASAASSHAQTVVQQPKLVSVRQNMQMPWNAVAIDTHSRVIVSSPHWPKRTGR